MSTIPTYRRQKCAGKADKAYTRVNGKRVYLGVYDSPESKKKFAALIAGPANDEPSPPSSDPTVCELMAAFLDFATDYYGADSTEFNHFKIAFRTLRKVAGAELAQNFGPKLFKVVRQAMVNDNDWSRNYVNDQASRIKRFVKWCVEEEYLSGDVYHALQSVRGLARGRSKARETSPVTAVPDEIVEATLPFLPEVVADMVRVQRFTGMRPGEMVQMRPCDIDRSGDVWLYTPRRHKNQNRGKQRVVAIGPKAQQVLLRYLARGDQMHLFRPIDSERKRRAARHANRKTPLKQGNSPGTNRVAKPRRSAGQRYTTESYRRAIHRACDRAFPHPLLSTLNRVSKKQRAELEAWKSAKRWSPHQLRHALATQARSSHGLDYVQSALGHANAKTSELYAELDQRKAVELAKRIG